MANTETQNRLRSNLNKNPRKPKVENKDSNAENIMEESKIELTVESKTTQDTTTKRKVGRPKVKAEETKNINIAIPISTLVNMDIAKECYQKNLTLYINTLIEKDLQENLDKYKMISEQLKQLNMV